DAMRGHRGDDGQGCLVLVAVEAVSENRHGPPASRRGAGREEEVKEYLVHALNRWRTSKRPDRRNVLPWVHFIIGREVLPEGDAAHRPGDQPRQGQVEPHRVKTWRLASDLLIPGDGTNLVQRKYGPRPVRPQVEVRRQRCGRMDLVTDLFQDGGG